MNTPLRRLAWLALVLAYAHIVFGAIVRITGSGMGCGDHWPKCLGHWFPPLDRPDLIIEVTHRYIAAALTAVVISLLAVALWSRGRDRAGAAVFGPSALSAFFVLAAAGFGALTVRFALANKAVIVTHLALAMGLLGSLTAILVRLASPPRWGKYDALESGTPANHRSEQSNNATSRTARLLALTATIAFGTILLGGLTAHVPGANSSCTGFPLCRGSIIPDDPNQHIQFTHRLLAYTLLGLLAWLGTNAARSGERSLAKGVRAALGLVIAQIAIAAALVELQLPAILRSLHQAVGTLLWIVLFALAYRAGTTQRNQVDTLSHARNRTALPAEA